MKKIYILAVSYGYLDLSGVCTRVYTRGYLTEDDAIKNKPKVIKKVKKLSHLGILDELSIKVSVIKIKV